MDILDRQKKSSRGACFSEQTPQTKSGCLEVQQDRDQERQQAEKFGGREADEQAALLAVGRRGVAPRAFEEATEDVAHTDGGHTGTDSGQTGADERSSRSEEHTSELQSLMRSSYAVLCFKKNNTP